MLNTRPRHPLRAVLFVAASMPRERAQSIRGDWGLV